MVWVTWVSPRGAAAAGGAMACVNSAPKLANVSISKNSSGGAGGGFYAAGGDVDLANVTITENTGGGIAMWRRTTRSLPLCRSAAGSKRVNAVQRNAASLASAWRGESCTWPR